jgi:hypothetical protein
VNLIQGLRKACYLAPNLGLSYRRLFVTHYEALSSMGVGWPDLFVRVEALLRGYHRDITWSKL